MPRFLTGDELGCIKSIHCSQDPQSGNEWKLEEKILFTPPTHVKINAGEVEAEKAKESTVQRLSLSNEPGKNVLAAACTNGALSTFCVTPENRELEISQEWREPRYKANHSFVGLDLSPKGLFWCTSNGALGFANRDLGAEETAKFSSSFQTASLPMRLSAWRLSPDASSFAYGGEEVDLSVWDTERALQSNTLASKESQLNDDSNTPKKRKRGGDLFPAEIWRAKNLPNDSLCLRQPIHITSLSYLPSSSSAAGSVHLVTGTASGDVRRYDTRAARRPVANWTGVGKVSGISVVQAGLSEHELFVADNGTNLSALDLRNGRIIYSYKKLQGAVTSVAPSSGAFLGSTSRDRFFRLHTTFPPPKIAGSQQDGRGEVLESLYMKSIPTAVVSDQSDAMRALSETSRRKHDNADESDGDNDDVWAEMEDVDDTDEEDVTHRRVKRQS